MTIPSSSVGFGPDGHLYILYMLYVCTYGACGSGITGWNTTQQLMSASVEQQLSL